MYLFRKVLAVILMFIASFFKILTVAIAPYDLKEEFRDSI